MRKIKLHKIGKYRLKLMQHSQFNDAWDYRVTENRTNKYWWSATCYTSIQQASNEALDEIKNDGKIEKPYRMYWSTGESFMIHNFPKKRKFTKGR
jgi:hypothetical protein